MIQRYDVLINQDKVIMLIILNKKECRLDNTACILVVYRERLIFRAAIYPA